MIAGAPISERKLFSAEAIDVHLQKIFSDRVFETSSILKRFLSFIVKETIEGHAFQLKEYTIGVSVLNKPADFKPQQDAIVRIHAGRLRRALNQYYKEAGESEPIRISIPKGSYVPSFAATRVAEDEQLPAGRSAGEKVTKAGTDLVVVAVLPFAHFGKGRSVHSFAEGLATLLTTELTHRKNLSVIAYYSMRLLSQKNPGMDEVISAVGAQYVFTGDILHQNNRIRINVQLINTETNEQVWSQVYERKLTGGNLFDIQDDLVTQLVSVFESYRGASRPTLTVA